MHASLLYHLQIVSVNVTLSLCVQWSCLVGVATVTAIASARHTPWAMLLAVSYSSSTCLSNCTQPTVHEYTHAISCWHESIHNHMCCELQAWCVAHSWCAFDMLPCGMPLSFLTRTLLAHICILHLYAADCTCANQFDRLPRCVDETHTQLYTMRWCAASCQLSSPSDLCLSVREHQLLINIH